MKKSIVH